MCEINLKCRKADNGRGALPMSAPVDPKGLDAALDAHFTAAGDDVSQMEAAISAYLTATINKAFSRAEAAEAKLAALQRDLDEAREALRPFADQANTHSEQMPDEMFVDDYERDPKQPWRSLAGIRIGELRRARTVLQEDGAAGTQALQDREGT